MHTVEKVALKSFEELPLKSSSDTDLMHFQLNQSVTWSAVMVKNKSICPEIQIFDTSLPIGRVCFLLCMFYVSYSWIIQRILH